MFAELQMQFASTLKSRSRRSVMKTRTLADMHVDRKGLIASIKGIQEMQCNSNVMPATQAQQAQIEVETEYVDQYEIEELVGEGGRVRFWF